MTSRQSRRMRSRWIGALLLAFLGLVAYTGSALATDASGFTSTTLSTATYGPTYSHVWNKAYRWAERIKLKGSTDVLVKQNTWDPGACGGCVPTTGWHTHLGPSFVTVTVGSVTVYDGSDRKCRPHVYTAGTATSSFVDPGDGHVHIVRDESGALAEAVVVQLIPTGAPTRVDAVDPGNCSF